MSAFKHYRLLEATQTLLSKSYSTHPQKLHRCKHKCKLLKVKVKVLEADRPSKTNLLLWWATQTLSKLDKGLCKTLSSSRSSWPPCKFKILNFLRQSKQTLRRSSACLCMDKPEASLLVVSMQELIMVHMVVNSLDFVYQLKKWRQYSDYSHLVSLSFRRLMLTSLLIKMKRRQQTSCSTQLCKMTSAWWTQLCSSRWRNNNQLCSSPPQLKLQSNNNQLFNQLSQSSQQPSQKDNLIKMFSKSQTRIQRIRTKGTDLLSTSEELID